MPRVRRAVPGKRGMAATFAVLGSTFSGLVHYLFGRFIPTFQQLMSSKVPPQPANYRPSPLRHV